MNQVNPFILEFIKIGKGVKGTLLKGSPEQIKKQLYQALIKSKQRRNKMNVSQLLAKLEDYKKEYNNISSQYGSVDYDSVTVYFGSKMWMDSYYDAPHCLFTNPNERSEKEIIADNDKVALLLNEADQLCRDNGLEGLLLEGTVAYWLGILPEPYTSVY